jgi:HEAT repeat protein
MIEDPMVREPACLLIGLTLTVLIAGCRGSKSTEEWLLQLGDPDAARRLKALHALGKIPEPGDQVVAALAKALQDKDAFVRRDAAVALGQIGPEARSAVPALLAAIKDRERQVRVAAVKALRIIDPEAATGETGVP